MAGVAPDAEDAMLPIRAEVPPNNTTVTLCDGPVPFYRQKNSWSCGYCCFMMMAVALAVLDGGGWAEALGNAGLITLAANDYYIATGVLPIQKAIADAWAAGINKDGEKLIRGRSKTEFVGSTGSKAKIGSCQAWAVFGRLRIPVTTNCFDEVDRVDKLFEAAREYFLMPGPRAPMILTHSNHVRLIVGFIDTPGCPQLIYVDPIWSEVDCIECFRKGDDELRAAAYEVMYLLDA